MKRGKFIVFEGIDGSGKSSQATELRDRLLNASHDIFLTAQPSKRLIGKTLRIFLSGEDKTNKDSLALLFASDRLDHILNEEDGVLKHLNEGKHVICDRNYFSNFAYQSDENDLGYVVDINKKARQILKPDVHIFIDVKPKIALERIKNARENIEIFENLENLTTIYNNFYTYFDMLKSEENIKIIDGDRAFKDISDDIFSFINNLILETEI